MPRSVTPHRFSASGPIRRLAGLTILTALVAAPALAQQPSGGQQPPGGSQNPAQPPVDDPSGTQPPVTEPGAPIGEPALPQEPPPDIDELLPEEEVQPQAEGAQLPPGFTPPPAELPEAMTIRKPLMTDEEIAQLENELRRYNRTGIDTVLIIGDPTAENKEALRRWARLLMAKMTAVKEWHEIDDVMKQPLLNLRNAGSRQQNSNRRREFREAVCEAMTQACAEVLENNFHVRMKVAAILSQLDVVPESVVGDRNPPVSYVPAMVPLLDILEDPKQPEAVKVIAAAGVKRIADYAELLPADLKYRAGDVLTQELAKKDTFWWYQMRLAEALAAIELDYNAARQPIVIEALLATIADDTRHCLARSAAAKALTRTRAPAGAFNDKAAADRIVQLARDMSLAYNKDPEAIHWLECFANLFYVFRPLDQDEVAQLPPDAVLRRGSLPAPLEDASGRITPIVKHVANQPIGGPHQPIPTEMIQRLNEFLAVAQQP